MVKEAKVIVDTTWQCFIKPVLLVVAITGGVGMSIILVAQLLTLFLL